MNQTQIGKGSEKVVDEFVRQIGKVSITAWAMPMWHRRRRPLVVWWSGECGAWIRSEP